MPNFNKELHINQVFKSIQGEGPRIGTPSLFIRMQYCNLQCLWCDTKYALGDDEHIVIANMDELDDFIEKIELASEGIYNLVLTGGEPLLYCKNEFLHEILESELWSTTEIETNGLLITEKNMEILKSVRRGTDIILNISPKLDVDCYKDEISIESIISTYIRKVDILCNYNIPRTWKFVYDPAKNGTYIREFVDKVLKKEYRENIWIMPLTPSRDSVDFGKKFRKNCRGAINFCIEHGFKYSPREHIWLFDPTEINEVEKII